MIAIYECKQCHNVVIRLTSGGPAISCCGDTMWKLTANTAEAAAEKHLPACTLDGDQLRVQVGMAAHPMTPEHSIQWIIVEQEDKLQCVSLAPGGEPVATFPVCAGEAYTVYEYCNLHGLWKIHGR